jgi:pimeloyl-ACP methyl ester carboxylesterase
MRDSPRLEDWGGSGPVLHLANANGFPPATYRKLIEVLKSRYHVLTLRGRWMEPGADPRSLKDWGDLKDDLIHALRSRGLRGVVGVGHSVGGVCTLLASAAEPELFRAVVALDPVLFTGKRAWALGALKVLGLAHKIPIASMARRRRDRWSSREEAGASYGKKALFRRFDPECFQNYLTHGLTEAPEGGFQLTIPKEWEARVFETSPLAPWRRLRQVKVPTLVLRGGDSDTLLPAALARIRSTVPGVRTGELPGTTHLFPLEQPEECGRRILTFLDEVGAGSAAGNLQQPEGDDVVGSRGR